MVEGVKKEGPEVTVFVEPGRVREARWRSGEQVAKGEIFIRVFFLRGVGPSCVSLCLLLFRDVPLCVVF